MNKDSAYNERSREPEVAVFKSDAGLLALNILPRMVLAAFIVMMLYFAQALLIGFMSEDPTKLFLAYWPYLVLLCFVLATVWTLWFQSIKIHAYKDRLIVRKRRKTWEITYASIISFELERDFFVIIPMPMEKTIIAAGSGRINTVIKCSCLTKKDFESLHGICNSMRLGSGEIPLRKSTTFHT